MDTLIVISNVNTGEYFFTKDHCQDHKLGSNWVPCTMRLPIHVVKRASCPDGLVKTKEEYKKVFHPNGIEIVNPDPVYQA